MTDLIKEKTFRFEMPVGKRKERIDLFLSTAIENGTRNRIQKLIEANLVKVNQKYIKSSYQVQPGDIIDVTIPISPRPKENEPENIPLNIIYEDEYLLIVNKEAGMVAHPAYANYTGTLVNALLHHINKLSNLNDLGRPGIVHRIDKNTSGLLVIAKDEWTHAQLASQFLNHTIEREYWAVVWGKMKEIRGEIDTYIARSKQDRKKFTTSISEGKHAVSMYQLIEEYEFASLLKLNLKTGRTHQLRVHLSSIGHPIFGDPAYGGREIIYGTSLPKMKSRIQNLLYIMPRQALHAKTLGFIHPHTKELVRFDSALPDDMKELIDRLKC
ncbi:MAG: RluA family pseudouridine synthase [Ignavibacteriaceae bacterium]|nr:RluA family pseudouridine synthase [Ignavibacteriaceae bacterium]